MQAEKAFTGLAPPWLTMKSRKTLWIIGLVLGLAGLYAGWLAYCAHANLVTLNVRNMEVREVVKKMERQTRESISVDKGVQGKITLKVRRKPLETVLRTIAEQTFSRPSVIYPLYSHDQSLAALQQALRGEVDPVTHGWTNLQNRFPGPFMFGPGGPGGMIGMAVPGTATSQKQLVSLNIIGKDIAFATLAFDRFARARVVPEDGTAGSVNLILKDAPVSKAVARLAKNVQRKWTTLYALQGGFGPGGPQLAGGDRVLGRERGEPPPFVRGENGPRPRGPRGPEPGDDGQREKFRQQREKLEEELKQALPLEERKKLEAAQQERQRQFEEFQNMTPEERAQRFAQMGGPNMGQMQRDRLLGSTPEQRAQMNRMRGPGGPGQGVPGGGGPGGPPR